MAVIDTSMDMPKSCSDCQNSKCAYCNKFWFINNPWTIGDKKDSITSRHSDCPLKSIDKMIAEIESYINDQYSENEYPSGGVILDIIHKYCGKEVEK